MLSRWLLLVSASIAPCVLSEVAYASISRCATSDGIAAYTDGSCRQLRAKPVPMPQSLLRNLLSDGQAISGNLRSTEAIERRRPRPHRADACARSSGQLASALQLALDDGDVNQLAALFDWTGISGRQSRPLLRRLEQLAKQPLLDGNYFPASDRTVQLIQGSEVAPSITELGVTERAGCLFLQF